jgi:hypothetical protein
VEPVAEAEEISEEVAVEVPSEAVVEVASVIEVAVVALEVEEVDSEVAPLMKSKLLTEATLSHSKAEAKNSEINDLINIYMMFLL